MGNEYLEHEEGSMGSFDRTEEINALKAELAEAEHAYNSKVNILGAENTALRSLLTEVNNDNEKIAIAAGEINEQRDALRKERDALRGTITDAAASLGAVFVIAQSYDGTLAGMIVNIIDAFKAALKPKQTETVIKDDSK